MNNYLKYSSMAFQMGTIIGIFAYGGYRLDAHYHMQKPIWTMVLSLIGVALALGMVIKDFIRPYK